MEKVVNNIIAFTILLGSYGFGLAQETTPPLERKVTLDLNGTTVKETLKLMETQGEYLFAYRTDLIEENIQLTRTYTNKTTRAILNDLFAGKITYKERGNYIILREQNTSGDKTVLLSGYISNIESAETVPYATIYDSTSLTSASSNEYGYYTLTLKNTENPLITVKKQGYRDTTIQWVQSGTSVFNIRLEQLPIIEDSTTEIIKENAKVKWFQRFMPNEEQKSKFNNFSQQLQRKTQVSLVPYIGSNGKLSGKTTVDYSFNTIGGFNGGVRVLEIGGIFNLVWDSVSYFQIAGVFNKVGGHQRGAQFAGATNINMSDVHGAQFAGATNITKGEVIGGQFAGVVNFADKFQGGQFAGVANYSRNKSIGGQFAGVFNKSEGNLKGAQVAGLMNIADDIEGAQVGFINISNSIDGVPVGFFSYSKKGLHQLELSTNEIFQANLAFKTGVNQFYNSFVGGIRFQSGKPVIGLGYGLGSSIRMSNKTRLFFDAQAMHVHINDQAIRPNFLGKLTMSYQWQITPLFAIAAGPSLNALWTEQSLPSGVHIGSLAPYSLYTLSDTENKLQFWAGGHIALRFF
jgi:hypothetical protein